MTTTLVAAAVTLGLATILAIPGPAVAQTLPSGTLTLTPTSGTDITRTSGGTGSGTGTSSGKSTGSGDRLALTGALFGTGLTLSSAGIGLLLVARRWRTG